jgi:hypothetical protein
MKSIILTAAMIMTSMVAMSQYTKEVEYTQYPTQEWYEIPGEDFEGVMYMTSTNAWIIIKLKEILKENGLSYSNPDVIQKQMGKVIYRAWEYVDSEGVTTFLAYVYNSETSSDISIEHKQD